MGLSVRPSKVKMASRIFGRLGSQLRAARQFATVHGSSATAGDHGGGARLWKILSFTVALPGVLVCYINAEIKEAEHHEHYERPEFVEYDHLRIRNKAFPWGDGKKSLFHNPKMNALPDGWEEE